MDFSLSAFFLYALQRKEQRNKFMYNIETNFTEGDTNKVINKVMFF